MNENEFLARLREVLYTLDDTKTDGVAKAYLMRHMEEVGFLYVKDRLLSNIRDVLTQASETECSEGAHRYGTPCLSCEATEAVMKLRRELDKPRRMEPQDIVRVMQAISTPPRRAQTMMTREMLRDLSSWHGKE